ncbi:MULTISPECIES: glycosyltransferase family 2 protein [Chryseobacterium]|uniref:Glycosyltransferase family 2 protein n=1 Tax=Chryseobacterium pennae TaxID=2258962 RepID=A0A3D9CE13_9FLAO|nr:MULTISPECIES: glycosyltransferase family 2 protein [Chryseobacterium]MCS4303110.1 glycosyltransferase involved in cell wall biosynthesis [Chryseobacterium sp. BIGb0232]REC64150.1 glycosyltransferase family 2 protein [Chryseobacterium pennae]ROS14603.1 glycosyltransferase involved in cell wall biosynthesis [Chryseobacterium nakagawai]
MRISVVIPVYNAEKFVTQAVDSVLQFDEVHEIILIEDKSPDNALQICRQLAEKHERIKLYQHPDKENHGAGPSRNLGIEKSTGDFVAFLDADDYFLPNRFDAEKELFKDPKVEGVYGALGVHYYSEKAKEQYYQLFGDRLTTVYKKYDPKDVFPGQLHMLGTFGLFSIDTLTIRRESLMNKVTPLFKPHLRLHEDTEFLFRLSYYLDLYPGILDEAIAVRGVHENNRITKVDLRVIDPSVSRAMLWKEVDLWSQTENEISEDVRIHIKRMHRSFEIAKAPLIKKWGMIIKYFFTDYKSIRSGLYNINFRHSLIS